jgi:hypothetical protein
MALWFFLSVLMLIESSIQVISDSNIYVIRRLTTYCINVIHDFNNVKYPEPESNRQEKNLTGF